MVKLYRFVEGSWRLVDLGVPRMTDIYLALGYLVRPVWPTSPHRRCDLKRHIPHP